MPLRRVIGIDAGGTKLLGGVVDSELVVHHRVHRTWRGADRRETVDIVLGAVEEIRAAAPDVAAVGFGIPALVGFQRGVSVWSNHLPIAGVPFRDLMSERLGLPVAVDNDGNAAALAEHRHGAAHGAEHAVLVALGTGIGGGLVLDGRLYLGSRGMSGVLGHTTVVPDGLPCGCGNHGCLERYASGTAIRLAGDVAKAAGRLGAWPDEREPSPQELAEAARAGNAAAAAIFAAAGTYLGVALGTVVCTLNPRAIVVGGGVSQAGNLLLAPLRQEIARRTAVFSAERGGVEVIQSPLGGEAGAIGSAIWARQGVEAA